MCRLYGFIANEPTKVDCSLVFAQNALMIQSRVDERGAQHADGWGIATYRDGVPEIQKRAIAAFDDNFFANTAERIYSTAIIAHVRNATVGQNSINNTHPFVSGNWVFAHNGTVRGFDKLGPQLASETAPELQAMRRGQTDSEQYFLWLLTRVQEQNDVDEESVSRLLRDSVAELALRCNRTEPSQMPRLNFVMTDGHTLFACRWNNSLHLIRREGIYNCEICGIPHIHHLETVNHRAVAVASEPLTHEPWIEVENKTVFSVQFDRLVSSAP